MKKSYPLAILVLLAQAVAQTVSAHAGHGVAALRTWTDTGTGRSFDAAFLLARGDTALFQAADETLVRTEISRLSESDRAWITGRTAEIHALNETPPPAPSETENHRSQPESVPIPVRFFEPFVPHVSLKWDEANLTVESDGMPEHPMMVGIRAWNQQVPLPQAYRGSNAFRIPLHPEVAPQSTPAPYLNAIAVAVNGVPIFHPIKQDGRTDTLLNGELDEYGGHAGRADDYHYHIAPRHLEKVVGEGNPVAYSLDGYPIVVAKEENGQPLVPLDENHGHLDADGGYRYYSTTSFPYLNITYRGVVDLDNRPRAIGVRPYTQPLRGTTITAFEKMADQRYRLTYLYNGETNWIDYGAAPNGGASFSFTRADGAVRTEDYGAPAKRNPRGEGEGRAGRERTEDRTGGREKGERGLARGESPPDGGPRQPWIVMHAAEIDANHDGTVTRAELTGEANNAFDGYDTDKDGTLSENEVSGRSNVRSAMGGFIKGHAREIDRNSDAVLSREELLAVAMRMFDRMDADKDGTLSPAEIQAAHRDPAQGQAGGDPDKGRRQRGSREGA